MRVPLIRLPALLLIAFCLLFSLRIAAAMEITDTYRYFDKDFDLGGTNCLKTRRISTWPLAPRNSTIHPGKSALKIAERKQ